MASVPDASFSVVRGSPSSSVLLHVPHAATKIPDWVRDEIVLSDSELNVEVSRMRDSHTDIASMAAADRARLRPHLFINELARQVVDPERFPDDREVMAQIGHGAVYLRTSQLTPLRNDDPEHADRLLEKYFHPYAQGISAEVQCILNVRGTVTVLDIHSFPRDPLPYELSSDPRPSICFGVDEFHTPTTLVDNARDAFAGFDIEVNSPFSGTYIPLEFYGSDRRVHGLMIELRRDVCSDPEAISRIIDGITSLIDLCD